MVSLHLSFMARAFQTAIGDGSRPKSRRNVMKSSALTGPICFHKTRPRRRWSLLMTSYGSYVPNTSSQTMTTIERARHYLRHLPGSIAGQNGDYHLYLAAFH